MKLALKELRYYAKRYILIELLIILMMFMVVFLIGLANGLSRVVSAGIEEIEAPYYLLSEEAEGITTFSNLSATILDDVKSKQLGNYTELTIQRTDLSYKDSNKLDTVYFAIDKDSFLAPEISEGKPLSSRSNELVLNERFREEGIALGDKVLAKGADKELTVVGFAKNAYYGHSSIAYVTKDTFEELNKAVNPAYTWVPQALVFETDLVKDYSFDGGEVLEKKALISKIPGYTAQQLTLKLIIWTLVVISSTILGVFFYIITLQKRREFGVMKAIGNSTGEIISSQLSQILILALSGVAIGLIVAYTLAQFLPKTLPFYLTASTVLPVVVAFMTIAILASLLSIRQIVKIDAIEVINGGDM